MYWCWDYHSSEKGLHLPSDVGIHVFLINQLQKAASSSKLFCQVLYSLFKLKTRKQAEQDSYGTSHLQRGMLGCNLFNIKHSSFGLARSRLWMVIFLMGFKYSISLSTESSPIFIKKWINALTTRDNNFQRQLTAEILAQWIEPLNKYTVSIARPNNFLVKKKELSHIAPSLV